MATVYDWPTVLKNHGHYLPYLEKQVASSGQTLTGNERVIGTDAGRWRYSFETRIWSKKFTGDSDRLLNWRALMAIVQGRLNVIRVPIFDGSDFAAASGLTLSAAQIPYSNTKVHTNGMGFAPVGINATCAVAAIGATLINAAMPTGVVPQPGQYFSSGDRLYLINSATLVSGTTYQLGFVPRLRSPFIKDQIINFTKLSCVMRLTDETIQKVVMSPASVTGSITLDFAEAL